ncbi:hypothetical protein BD324DRAFT_43104 [Kockovaella imperatae]|uniref:Secreted protein n=1 Tax=Kockovaella imperatae TaxID=4999 RepID=A0A1Y1UU22_9TREE|nr:hypothetical protein BD324DRAFT_43104 [Kockovaella imperatae]ORX41127.1 hypothetical protein BD324DRAFT_43104 [Kockovaella imperatae]
MSLSLLFSLLFLRMPLGGKFQAENIGQSRNSHHVGRWGGTWRSSKSRPDVTVSKSLGGEQCLGMQWPVVKISQAHACRPA